MEAEQRLKALLVEGSYLLDKSSSSSHVSELRQVLENRLTEYYTHIGEDDRISAMKSLPALEDVQLQTAKEACRFLEKIQLVLEPNVAEGNPSGTEPPAVGSRDLTKLRTLLSLVFKWGLQLLTERLSGSWKIPSSTPFKGAQIIDLTTQDRDYETYSSLLKSMFALIFYKGVEGPIAQTYLTTFIIQNHSTDILIPSLSLGWYPDSLSSASMPAQKDLRPFVVRFLRLLSSSQAMSSLAQILSSSQSIPPHVRKVSASLLTKQLLRNDGVLGLFEALFGGADGAGEEVRPEKLEHVARILLSVPVNMNVKDYYRTTLPRVIKFLSEKAHPTHRRAAAFVLYRCIVADKPSPNQKEASTVVLDALQTSFTTISASNDTLDILDQLQARHAIESIVSLISNSEPLPEFISRILSPVLSDIYMLSYDLEKVRTVDPQIKELVRGILLSWGKIIDPKKGCEILWSIIKGEKMGQWRCSIEGKLWRTASPETQTSLSLLNPEDVKRMATEADDSNFDMNLFDQYPDPTHFVTFLKSLEREDITTDLFVRLLEDYRFMKTHSDQDPMKVLNELQLIVQMQAQLTDGTKSNILRKPDQLLTFILHVLQSARVTIPGQKLGPTEDTLEEDNSDDVLDGDSDDDDPESETIGPDDELLETAMTLLLSILEANDKLPPRTFQTLHEIFLILEKLASHGRPALMTLAREARLVITAKLANEAQESSRGTNEDQENVRETYQKALKLLQDPILPVRAHGLLLLRQLLATSKTSPKELAIVQTLTPSILSIFLQSIQDNDSYIFLNAVQGLAAMVDSFGKDVLRSLVQEFTRGLTGLGSGNLSQQDLDNRTRIAEALSNVIKRCGTALGRYVDLIVPPVFAIMRSRDVPTVIRSSSISLLGACVDTYPLALLPYLEDLADAMLDLLQLESVVVAPETIRPAKQQAESAKAQDGESKRGEDTRTQPSKRSLDADPTTKNSKLPPLRRSALHFFNLLLRSTVNEAYEEKVNFYIPVPLVRRARNTLGYLSSTDDDPLVRIMAREAIETFDQLQEAILGL